MSARDLRTILDNEAADGSMARHARATAQRLAVGPMTPDELFEQKVSWVYGQMMDCDPTITKEQVRKRLEANR